MNDTEISKEKGAVVCNEAEFANIDQLVILKELG